MFSYFSKATNIEVSGLEIDVASGGLPKFTPEIAYGNEKKYFEKPAMERQQDTVDQHNVGAHKSKIVCYLSFSINFLPIPYWANSSGFA